MRHASLEETLKKRHRHYNFDSINSQLDIAVQKIKVK